MSNPKLLIMACPICGAREPHAEDIPQGYQDGDAQLVWCEHCDTECVVIVNSDEDEA